MPKRLTSLLGMPRRVFTFGAGMGRSWLPLWSTVAALVFAVGFFAIRPGLCAVVPRRHSSKPEPMEGGHAGMDVATLPARIAGG